VISFREFEKKALGGSATDKQKSTQKDIRRKGPRASKLANRKNSADGFNAPKKSLGQNFLSSEKHSEKIASAVELLSQKHGLRVIEIGPGRGALTEELIKRGIPVLGVEKDDYLSRHLQDSLPTDQFRLIHQDVLEFLKSPPVNCSEYLICGNLPFNISKKILIESVYLGFPAMVFMFQKEVADDILLRSKKNFLGFFSDNYLSAQKVCDIPRHLFNPTPKVDATAVSMTLKNNLGLSMPESQKFFRFIRNSMLNKRKKIKNIFSFTVDESISDMRIENLNLAQLYEIYTKSNR
jgi:16S rRNA (adenine1518-N6/adenine1519-N6)-dimethyltransferase